MVGGFPIVWIVSLLSKKMDSTVVTKIFECYK
jgi:SSS family solute:Na+ symporter